jgi:hypothetical protein
MTIMLIGNKSDLSVRSGSRSQHAFLTALLGDAGQQQKAKAAATAECLPAAAAAHVADGKQQQYAGMQRVACARLQQQPCQGIVATSSSILVDSVWLDLSKYFPLKVPLALSGISNGCRCNCLLLVNLFSFLSPAAAPPRCLH